MKAKHLIPLGIFLTIAVFLAIGLNLNPREVPSPLIGKPAPQFSLPDLFDPEKKISPEDFKGQVWMLNVWATWCVSCRAEHPVLVDLAKRVDFPIVSLDYKDEAEPAKQWLQRLGNPYTATAFDADGMVGIDWGVYGTPETYLIDKAGIIQYKHIGPLTPQVLSEKILPLVKSLQESA
ncbi:MAG: DsbE family thiol:disulfide interchange protein [Thiotrichales bacterium]